MAHQRTGAVTLQDVARVAGVSLATASRAINGSTRQVREELRDRVLEAAHRLNYAANSQAQAVAKGRTNVVGLLVHDIADPYFPRPPPGSSTPRKSTRCWSPWATPAAAPSARSSI